MTHSKAQLVFIMNFTLLHVNTSSNEFAKIFRVLTSSDRKGIAGTKKVSTDETISFVLREPVSTREVVLPFRIFQISNNNSVQKPARTKSGVVMLDSKCANKCQFKLMKV